MRRRHLTIYPYKTPVAQLRHQSGKHYFACIRVPMEHTFGKKYPAKRHPVDSARQFISLPNLRRMRQIHCMQALISLLHLRADPSTRLPGAGRRTPGHHRRKRPIQAEPEPCRTHPPPQPPGHMELFRTHHATRIRRPPQNRLPLIKPWEHPLPISRDQPIRRKRPAMRQRARAIGRRQGRELDFWGGRVDHSKHE